MLQCCKKKKKQSIKLHNLKVQLITVKPVMTDYNHYFYYTSIKCYAHRIAAIIQLEIHFYLFGW